MSALRLLTRGSALALAQSQWVVERLQAAHPGLAVEIRTVKTRGDRITDRPLSQIGGKGLFVKEIEESLLNGEGDFAVHSLKDMTSQLAPGLLLAAVPEREDPRDALVLPVEAGVRRQTPDASPPTHTGPLAADARRLASANLPVPEGGVVGSSSLRRRAQLKAWRPDLTVAELRGNLDTRLRKLDAGDYDAIVLAVAGLRRLGQEARISLALPVERFVPAVGQGALGIEARENDAATLALLTALEHAPTRTCITAERAFLVALEGDCSVPLGALATYSNDRLTLTGMLADTEAQKVLRQTVEGPVSEAAALGAELAEVLLAAGGDRLPSRLPNS